MATQLNLTSYRLLGRSGLRISPFAFPHELLRMPTVVGSISGGTQPPARTW